MPIPPGFEGEWVDRDPVATEQRVERAIDEVLGEMAFWKRPLARGPLRQATVPCDVVVIDEHEGLLRIDCDDEPPAIAPVGGAPATYVASDGETYALEVRVLPDRIVQEWRGDRGTRRNVYTLEGGHLVVHTTVSSPRLPRPVEVEYTFAPGDPAAVGSRARRRPADLAARGRGPRQDRRLRGRGRG